jgi:hypothetical protein
MRTRGLNRRAVLATAAVILAAATAAAAEFRVQADLVSAVRDVQAGTPFWVAVRQRIDPGRIGDGHEIMRFFVPAYRALAQDASGTFTES